MSAEHPTDESSPTKLASPRHTVGLAVVLLVLSIAGAIRRPISEWPEWLSRPGARSVLYLQVIALQWLYVLYIWFGIRRSGESIRRLIDDARPGLLCCLRYLAIAIGGLLFWLAVGAGLSEILRPTAEQLRGLQAMLPKTSMELRCGWCLRLSTTFCEEIVYRGYFLRQFRALTRSTLAAVFLQAVIYGMAHLSLPMEMVISVSLLGILLGGLAAWQKSLVPGILLRRWNRSHGSDGLRRVRCGALVARDASAIASRSAIGGWLCKQEHFDRVRLGVGFVEAGQFLEGASGRRRGGRCASRA